MNYIYIYIYELSIYIYNLYIYIYIYIYVYIHKYYFVYWLVIVSLCAANMSTQLLFRVCVHISNIFTANSVKTPFSLCFSYSLCCLLLIT